MRILLEKKPIRSGVVRDLHKPLKSQDLEVYLKRAYLPDLKKRHYCWVDIANNPLSCSLSWPQISGLHFVYPSIKSAQSELKQRISEDKRYILKTRWR